MDTTNRFEYIAKVLLYVLATLLPIWFIPWRFDVEFGREVTFWTLAIIATLFWLLSLLKKSEVRWMHSPVLLAGGLMFLVLVVSTIFSKAPYASAVFGDATGEKLSSFVLALLAMILVSSVLRSREEAGKLSFIIIFTGALSGVLSVLQLFGWSPFQLPVISSWLPFLARVDFNVIGTVNSLVLFYAVLFSMSVGMLLGAKDWPVRARTALSLAAVVFFVNLLLINFWISWLVLLVSSIFMFGLLFRGGRQGEVGKSGWRYWAVLTLIVFSVVMLMVRAPIIRAVSVPAEVSPSHIATLKVVSSVFKEGPKNVLLGSGPATFGLDWSRFKDLSINQTIFWGVRFVQGASWVETLLVTTGVLGAVSVLILFAAALFIFLRRLLATGEESSALAAGVFMGVVSFLVASFFYPINLSFLILFFMLLGAVSVLLGAGREGKNFLSLDVVERVLKFESPSSVFVASLVAVFCISLGVAGLYFTSSRVRAALAAQEGVLSLSRGGVDEAVSRLEQASALEPSNFRYPQALVRARMEKIRSLIQRAGGGENVQADFQQVVALAIQNAQQGIALNSADPAVYRLQGTLYELIIPFINGAESFSAASYAKAAELEPSNPAIYTEWGRALLTFADRLQILAGQASGETSGKIQEARIATLQEAERVLRKAIEVKPDYAAAHFLLAQVALRLGNAALAIQSAENAKLSAPFDIGIAFQLGLLYYQSGDLGRAETEFLRSASINPNYSNARYFLGLIYDRGGREEEAIAEFEKVLAFNPDNEEIQKILANLRKGKSALAGISPPGEAPEKRKETPVK